MSAHKTPREVHREHADNRNEAAARVRLLAGHEQAVRQRTVDRLVGVLVQQPAQPHHFIQPGVTAVSPRRVLDVPDLPGGPSTDWEGAIA